MTQHLYDLYDLTKNEDFMQMKAKNEDFMQMKVPRNEYIIIMDNILNEFGQNYLEFYKTDNEITGHRLLFKNTGDGIIYEYTCLSSRLRTISLVHFSLALRNAGFLPFKEMKRWCLFLFRRVY